MKLGDAFLSMTGIAYLAAAILGLALSIQFDRNMSVVLQSVAYIVMGIVFLVAVLKQNKILFGVLGVGYVLIGLWCYADMQDWGSTGHNLFMTAWDLGIGVISVKKL